MKTPFLDQEIKNLRSFGLDTEPTLQQKLNEFQEVKRLANLELHAAVSKLAEALKTDEGYKMVWTSNIAMCFKDAHQEKKKNSKKSYLSTEAIHEISNEAACRFIELLTQQYPI